MDATERINQLKKWRARRTWDCSITATVQSIAANAEKNQRQRGELIDLWETIVPADLVVHTRIAGLRGGIVQVIVDSSATRYELDGLLRAGLESELRTNFSGRLRKFKMTVGSIE